MADLEIRAFGRRFLAVWDKRPEPEVESNPGTTAGDFSPAPGNEIWRDGEVMALGFGFEGR